jgi:hypothetical protein
MVARCVAIEGGGKWNACLLGYKTIAAFWFAMIVFLKTTSLSFIWLALLFSSETIFEMCSSLSSEGFPNIEAVTCICDPIILIAPLNHPWASQEEIDVQDLIDGNFIMRETSSGTFSAIREALAHHDIPISDLNVLITLGNAEAIAIAVQEGIGVGFVSKPVVD